MLMTEWNWEDALAVRYKEGHEDGIVIGEQKGIAIGEQKGIAIGEQKRDIAIARNALAKGFSFETIHDLTGLDMEKIQNL